MAVSQYLPPLFQRSYRQSLFFLLSFSTSQLLTPTWTNTHTRTDEKFTGAAALLITLRHCSRWTQLFQSCGQTPIFITMAATFFLINVTCEKRPAIDTHGWGEAGEKKQTAWLLKSFSVWIREKIHMSQFFTSVTVFGKFLRYVISKLFSSFLFENISLNWRCMLHRFLKPLKANVVCLI